MHPQLFGNKNLRLEKCHNIKKSKRLSRAPTLRIKFQTAHKSPITLFFWKHTNVVSSKMLLEMRICRSRKFGATADIFAESLLQTIFRCFPNAIQFLFFVSLAILTQVNKHKSYILVKKLDPKHEEVQCPYMRFENSIFTEDEPFRLFHGLFSFLKVLNMS